MTSAGCSPLIVALDDPSFPAMQRLVGHLDPQQCRVKVGKALFTAAGPEAVRWLHREGFQVFLDLKFHDIPHTVAQAVEAAADLGVWMVNVHALGGPALLAAARAAVGDHPQRPWLIAVTLLTSLGDDDLVAVGLAPPMEIQVMRLARLAHDHGLDGVVCSAAEATAVRDGIGADFLRVTPGIRLPEDAHHDQQRVMTPTAALDAGAQYLVIGRSITAAAHPRDRLAALHHGLYQSHPTAFADRRPHSS